MTAVWTPDSRRFDIDIDISGEDEDKDEEKEENGIDIDLGVEDEDDCQKNQNQRLNFHMSPLFYEKVLITSFDEQLVQLFSVLHSVFKHQQPKIFSQKQRGTKHTNWSNTKLRH